MTTDNTDPPGDRHDHLADEADGQPILSARLMPHRSLGPRGFAAVMAVACLVSFSAGYMFYRIGAWPVMGFCGLDVIVIYLAFRFNYRAARAYEEIEVRPHEIIVRKTSARGRASEFRFNPYWVRLELQSSEDEGVTRILLFSRGRGLAIGDFLNPGDRTDFASVFANAIRQARA